MAYIDCGGPPEDLVRVVKERLKDKGLEGMLEHFDMSSSLMPYLSTSSSSDEESTATSKLTRSIMVLSGDNCEYIITTCC